MNTSLVPFAARLLLAALFVVAGYNKLANLAGTTGYMAKLGLPSPQLMTWAVITVELLGALLLVIGWKTRGVAWALAAFTVATAVIGHAFWNHEGAQYTSHLTQFLKNLAIAGGFMMLAVAGPGRLSADGK